jgi:CRISPR-associated protein Cas2
VIVVTLSVTPERLRGELTRWLLEISQGVYVGHLSARVRDRLWQRIVEDVGSGRAIMVWSSRNEQLFSYRVHNHSWDPVDFDGLTLMRRDSTDSRELRRGRTQSASTGSGSTAGADDRIAATARVNEPRPRPKSIAGQRRRYRNAVERRHTKRPPGTGPQNGDD